MVASTEAQAARGRCEERAVPCRTVRGQRSPPSLAPWMEACYSSESGYSDQQAGPRKLKLQYYNQ